MIEKRLLELGIELPPAAAPVASYVPVRTAGGLAFCAGQIPSEDGTVLLTGAVDADVSLEQAQDAARRCALQALAALREALGSLDRVLGIAQLTVYVASSPGFTQQSAVANGASEVLVEVFGEEGRHARAAVGVAELPLGASVEVAVTSLIR
ncbi:MAG TPA: RidA family protein [Actinomycetota bacterium]|nr:RidA family protein [Actinomycetota bacterium]